MVWPARRRRNSGSDDTIHAIETRQARGGRAENLFALIAKG
jgi:hypothetical protein